MPATAPKLISGQRSGVNFYTPHGFYRNGDEPTAQQAEYLKGMGYRFVADKLPVLGKQSIAEDAAMACGQRKGVSIWTPAGFYKTGTTPSKEQAAYLKEIGYNVNADKRTAQASEPQKPPSEKPESQVDNAQEPVAA